MIPFVSNFFVKLYSQASSITGFFYKLFIHLRLPFHQLQFKKFTGDSPVIYYTEQGMLSHFEGIEFSKLLEMYYRCNGTISYTERDQCEAGPFNNRYSIISNPSNIQFDENERPIGFFNRN